MPTSDFHPVFSFQTQTSKFQQEGPNSLSSVIGRHIWLFWAMLAFSRLKVSMFEGGQRRKWGGRNPWLPILVLHCPELSLRSLRFRISTYVWCFFPVSLALVASCSTILQLLPLPLYILHCLRLSVFCCPDISQENPHDQGKQPILSIKSSFNWTLIDDI